MSEPLHVAFVWHMHQPYYRLGPGHPFEMPWARLHALKDYLDMVTTLADYPPLHQTFNLVPSLVEQLEVYAGGHFDDVYWNHTMKPATDLEPAEQAFVVERLCERSGHPRARINPRYAELIQKRDAHASQNWEACARAFSVDELRDLQIWFNLAWFDPQYLEKEPLASLVARGRDFCEEDKLALAQVQEEILAQTLPAYREAAARGQIELSTSPYFHPILPLLANTDAARVSAPDTLLPSRRFAYPEDAAHQVRMAVAKHQEVFGQKPQGMWCSEQSVGEDVIPLLTQAGMNWTISDEVVLRRSLSGTVASLPDAAGIVQAPASDPHVHYRPYLLEREGKRLAIVFRDHALSDLIGFSYQSWNAHDAVADLLTRLRNIRSRLISEGAFRRKTSTGSPDLPLVTIALDGENAWEYYPRDGRDFLEGLYEGLCADGTLRCVTIAEHLSESPAVQPLPWLHTGSWIGGDLGTWIGDRAHGSAWDALHEARDCVTAHTQETETPAETPGLAKAWHHIRVAEGSDWFWWFGDRHHTELDYVWDLNFRRHLREVYSALGETAPLDLSFPLLQRSALPVSTSPQGPISPSIDGRMGEGADGSHDEWEAAGVLIPDTPSTMQRAEGVTIREVHYGWRNTDLCLLVAPRASSLLPGLEMQVRITQCGGASDIGIAVRLEDDGRTVITAQNEFSAPAAREATGAWNEVLEFALPMGSLLDTAAQTVLIVELRRDGVIEHTFTVASLTLPTGP
jgi:alpha-amylase/alpha-mannosidase (GH57 family)